MASPQITAALKLAHLAARYAQALDRSGGKHTDSVCASLFDLCNAAIDVVDDGDFYAQRATLIEEYQWDGEGFPIDDNGFRTGADRYAASLSADCDQLCDEALEARASA